MFNQMAKQFVDDKSKIQNLVDSYQSIKAINNKLKPVTIQITTKIKKF